MEYKYYLKDLEDPYAEPSEITLQAMEKARNDTDPPEPYSIKCHADVIGADMYNFYSEVNYELIAVPIGVPEWDYKDEEEEDNRFIITTSSDELNAGLVVGSFYYNPDDERSFLAAHRDVVIASSAPKMFEILKKLYYGAKAFLVPEIAKEISMVIDPIEGVINAYDSLYAKPAADKKEEEEEEDMKEEKMDTGSSNVCPMCDAVAASPTRSELSADGIHSLDYTCPRCKAEWVSAKSIHSNDDQWRTTVVGPVHCAECGADCKFDKAETEVLNAYDSIHRRYYKCTECWYSQVNRRLISMTNPTTGDLTMSEWKKEYLAETKSCGCVECSHKSDTDSTGEEILFLCPECGERSAFQLALVRDAAECSEVSIIRCANCSFTGAEISYKESSQNLHVVLIHGSKHVGESYDSLSHYWRRKLINDVSGLAEVVEADQLNEDVEWFRTLARNTRERLRYLATKYHTCTPIYLDCPSCGEYVEPEVKICKAVAPIYKDSDGNPYVGLVDVCWDATDENAYCIRCPKCSYLLAETCKEFDEKYLKQAFLDDGEKLVDLFKLTKQEFLESYSYLSEIEYDRTVEVIKERLVCSSPQE